MDALNDEVRAEHQMRLEEFVARARRIETHSLLSDLVQFTKWVHGTGHLEVGPAGGQMSFDLPPEEAFESLAARCRPFTLNDEPIYFHKVLGSLKAFARKDPELRRTIEVLRKGWQRAFKPDAPIQMGLSSALGVRPTDLLTPVEIADGWLYGELVHANPTKRAAISQIPPAQRFFCAVMVYGQVAWIAKATLNVVIRWQDAGVLDLNPAVFTETVAAATPVPDPPLHPDHQAES